MHSRIRCRWCDLNSSLNFASSANPTGGRKSFAIAGSKPHYAPDVPFRIQHILLDVIVDPKGKTLKGSTTQKVQVVSPNQTTLVLDQVGLVVKDVRLNGKQASYSVEGWKLSIDLKSLSKKDLAPGAAFEFSVKFEVSNPRRGLYFTGPDQDYPKKPLQVWSQGQDEDNRYWFPSFDYPNQKATSEIIAIVPKGYTAVANGALLSRKDAAGGTRFHYKLGTPHVTYLISLVVAQFSEWEDKGPRGLPVQYFCEKGREADTKRAFGATPKMIAAFEKKVGVNYPYEKYSQVAVQDFIFGGMENTSATTQTDRVLHDERAHQDFSADGLVSHELAHQWFGDLLTCRDWSHAWLNEGFATFMERVWIESDPGPNGGWEEAKYYSYIDLKEYLAEDNGSYRRPIVCNTYIEPIDLFDRHLYQKGGLVLNFIRYVLGEELFWKSINLYVNRHRGQNVETLDLIRAIEEATGKNLRRVFDEWVFAGGYPEFELSYSYDPKEKLVELVIEQKQAVGDGPLFHLPAVIELTFGKGKKSTHRIELQTSRERIFLSAPSQPVMVRFDPDSNIPKTLKFPRPKELLLYQLANDPDCMGRIEAAKELGKVADDKIVEALGKAALSDKFWGVQTEAAAVLAELRTERARDALIAALKTKNPKARRAVVNALGAYKDKTAAVALRKLAEKDSSYFVEADATTAYASAALSPIPAPKAAEIDEVERFLMKQMEKDSFSEVIRGAALKSMSELPGIGRGERPKAMSTLIDSTRRGVEVDVRNAAIVTLGKIAKFATNSERARIFEVLSKVADDESFFIRRNLLSALRTADASDGIEILERVRATEADGRVKRDATLIIQALQAAGSTPEALSTLKDQLAKLEEEHRKLKAQVEESSAKSRASAKSKSVRG